MIGLTPLVTFYNATVTHRVAKMVNLDRLLLETDAPYFIPNGVSDFLSAVYILKTGFN